MPLVWPEKFIRHFERLFDASIRFYLLKKEKIPNPSQEQYDEVRDSMNKDKLRVEEWVKWKATHPSDDDDDDDDDDSDESYIEI